MGDPLRIQNPKTIYLVGNRCVMNKFMLRPDAEVNAIILACLGRAQTKHKVELMGFIFMGNHFHMILRCTALQLSDFMRDFQSWLATKMRAHLGIDPNTKHPFWAGNFFKTDLLDDAQVFQKLIYILANACAADIVARPEQYPGISSLSQHYTGKSVEGIWYDEEAYSRKKRSKKPFDAAEVSTRHQITLTPLPAMASLSQHEIATRIKRSLEARVEALGKARTAAGKSVEGRTAVQRRDPFSSPAQSKTSPCPPCLGSDPEAIAQHREHVQRVTERYRKARKLERDPKRTTCVKYPPGTFPPGTHICTPFETPDPDFYFEPAPGPT